MQELLTPSALGEKVHVLRRRKKLTQQELGKKAGLSGNTIARLETGRIMDLKFQAVIALAHHLGVTPNELAGYGND